MIMPVKINPAKKSLPTSLNSLQIEMKNNLYIDRTSNKNYRRLPLKFDLCYFKGRPFYFGKVAFYTHF